MEKEKENKNKKENKNIFIIPELEFSFNHISDKPIEVSPCLTTMCGHKIAII